MGYAGQLALGAAGFMAAGAFACYNLILRIPDIPFCCISTVRINRSCFWDTFWIAKFKGKRNLLNGCYFSITVFYCLDD